MKRGSNIDVANLKSICGALFFGVPNQGLDIASLVPMVKEQPNQQFLESLGRSSERLYKQAKEFEEAFDFRDSKIISFYETKLSKTAQRVCGFVPVKIIVSY